MAIIAGGAIMGITVGIRQVFGLFLAPISVDLGLGREIFAFGMGLMNLVWGLAAPFAGAVADRFGAGRVAVAGGLTYAAGLVAMTGSGDGTQLVVGGLLIGIGLSGAGFTVVLGAVGRAAPPESRTTALGLVSVGGSIGQFVALPYAHFLIEATGWSASLLILAATTMLVVPLAFG
ncbi:MAG: MFS transporter, partial [Alphaproteobacteria bacterium]|nr:MFS transporter [Alphaproteobacteria bacterium]